MRKVNCITSEKEYLTLDKSYTVIKTYHIPTVVHIDEDEIEIPELSYYLIVDDSGTYACHLTEYFEDIRKKKLKRILK